MAESGKITRGLYEDLTRLLGKSGQDPQFRPNPTPQRRPRTGQRCCFMLLEEIESGKTAWAAKLTSSAAWERQLITIYGLRQEEAKFGISWEGETVTGLSIFATPAEVRAKLLEFSFLSETDVTVQLGNHSRPINGLGTADSLQEFNTFRWIVKLRPGLGLGLMEPEAIIGNSTWSGAEVTTLEDSYETIKVQSLLPVGVDSRNVTPMQPGAIGLASFMHTPERPWGWVIDSLEARQIYRERGVSS